MPVTLRGSLTVLGGALVHLPLGTISTFGNLTPYLTSYIRHHAAPSSLTYSQSVWISAVSPVGQGLGMLITGHLQQKVGPRLAILIGSFLLSLGVLMTYFSIQNSFACVAATYGLMFGLGCGLAYTVPISCGMRWMPERKGLVSGFLVAGCGAGAFVFDKVQTAFINPNNKAPDLSVGGEMYFSQEDILKKVPHVFLLLGGIYAVIQFIGCMLITDPPSLQEVPNISHFDERQPLLSAENSIQTPSLHDEINAALLENNIQAVSLQDEINAALLKNGIHNVSLHDEIHAVLRRTNQRRETHVNDDMTFREMLKTRAFYKLWFILLFNGQGVIFITSLYKAYGQTFITDDTFLIWVGQFAAVFNMLGGILWGYLSDRFSFKIAMTCLCSLFTALMLTLSIVHLAGKVMFLVWICLLFLALSGNFSLMPTATAKCFGQTYYTTNYGLMFSSMMITSPIGAVFSSQLKDALGWYGMFSLVAAFSFISFLLAISFHAKTPDGKEV